MFSRLTGKGKGEQPRDIPDAQRVFASTHITADTVGPVLCVFVVGETMSEREAGILFDETDAQINDRCTSIVVDLSSVTMMSSAGIGALVRIHKRIDERKGQLAVCGLSEELIELFKLTRMDRLFRVAPDRDAAIAVLLKT